MEVFTINVDGSYRFSFRKSLAKEKKELLCLELSQLINLNCTKRVVNGVLVLYLTPSTENTVMLSELVKTINSKLFTWNSHFKY